MKHINQRSLSAIIVVIALAALLLWTTLFIVKLNNPNYSEISKMSMTVSQWISYKKALAGNNELIFGAESFTTIIFAAGLLWLVNKK